MALAERAALGVLAGQTDRVAVAQQRREGERLGVRPVDPLAINERLAPALELLDELGMDGEAVADAQQLLVELLQHARLDRRRDLR